MTIHKVEIEVNAVGHGSCLIDGQDVSSLLAGIRFESEANHATQVYLRLRPGCEIVLQGEALVSPEQDRLAKEVLIKIIEGLNPTTIEKAALEGAGWDDEEGTTAAIIRVIKEQINGA